MLLLRVVAAAVRGDPFAMMSLVSPVGGRRNGKEPVISGVRGAGANSASE